VCATLSLRPTVGSEKEHRALFSSFRDKRKGEKKERIDASNLPLTSSEGGKKDGARMRCLYELTFREERPLTYEEKEKGKRSTTYLPDRRRQSGSVGGKKEKLPSIPSTKKRSMNSLFFKRKEGRRRRRGKKESTRCLLPRRRE